MLLGESVSDSNSFSTRAAKTQAFRARGDNPNNLVIPDLDKVVEGEKARTESQKQLEDRCSTTAFRKRNHDALYQYFKSPIHYSHAGKCHKKLLRRGNDW
ncbi:hypothetical protein PVK06_002206 [Gossypium arboreum]|uniref:Uncharacterized protein n=1 Tax=Gossypium arboreum TaxID=29729 RepID=A0ABR0R2Z9_GOSAR|nr:hypothetical protein PVK06_002206 [Gossypium arboreum]